MPIGLSTYFIKDHQLSSSSSYDENNQAHFARLLNTSYWRPEDKDTSPWLQIQFEERMVISGLVLDGDWSITHRWIWLEQFYLTYSSDGEHWKPYIYSTNNDQVIVHNELARILLDFYSKIKTV